MPGERLDSKPLTELSGAQIMDRAVAATAKVRTVHIRTTAGTTAGHLEFDLRRTSDGECYGRLTLFSGTVSAILTEDHTYFRGNAAFWRGAKISGVSSDMTRTPWLWARMPATDSYRLFCDVEDLPEAMGLYPEVYDELRSSPPHPGRDGRTVVYLTDPRSDYKVTVATEAPHYLVEIRSFGAHAVLSEFDEPASVRIPTDDEVVPFVSGNLDS